MAQPMVRPTLRLYTKVMNGPGELDFMLHLIGRKEDLSFKLGGDDPTSNTGWFMNCKVATLRACEPDEKMSGDEFRSPDFELLLSIKDHIYPELGHVRLSYNLRNHKGLITELLAKRDFAQCEKAKRLLQSVEGCGNDLDPTSGIWLRDHLIACDRCRSNYRIIKK